MRVALFFFIAMLVLVFLFGGQFGLISLLARTRYQKKLEEDLLLEKARKDSLTEVLNRLKTDSEYLEKIARERLILHKKGERIYRFEEK